MNWGEVLLIIVTHCSSVQPTNYNACRIETTDCVDRAITQNPASQAAAKFINTCLSDYKSYPTPVEAKTEIKKEEEKK